jgi:chromosome segregation ATPase
MTLDTSALIIALAASIMSGTATGLIAHFRESKKERARQAERYQDHLKLELKDLKIQLFQLEKELTEWKDKYYKAIQELIEVKSELEETMLKLSFIDKAIEEYHPVDPED